MVEQEDGAELVIPADIRSSVPKPVEDVVEQKKEKHIPKGTAVRSHEEGIAGIIHTKTEPKELEQNIKEILEQADPKVREEVAKELEKEEESVPVLVDKANKTVLEPLVNKGRSLLKSLASGKSKKVSWIDTPHEPKH